MLIYHRVNADHYKAPEIVFVVYISAVDDGRKAPSASDRAEYAQSRKSISVSRSLSKLDRKLK